MLLDPLAPPPSAREAWERIEAFAPDTVVIVKPDHVRDVDLFVRWYGARALGPFLFWRDDIPKTELERRAPRRRAAGRAGRARRRARDDGDAALPARAARAGVRRRADRARRRAARLGLRAHGERALPALRAMLELPFEHVLVSHGEPVHTRADFEAALEREPYSEPEGS